MKKNYYEEEEFEDDELDLNDLIFTLLRRWKVILLIAFPIFIIGVFIALTRPSIYKAETVLIVSNSPSGISVNSGDIAVNHKLVITYSEIAKSRDIMSKVIQKYDLQESLKTMAKNIEITPIADTELLKLSYTNGDAKLSESVTNELASEFIKKIGQVMRVRNINIVEKAVEPQYPLPKKRGLIILGSIVLGIFAGIGVAFLIEVLHSKVRKSSDIEKILDVKMLGMIPEVSLTEEENNSHES